MDHNADIQLRKRLEDLVKRIDAKIQNIAEGDLLGGAEREAAAEWRLQHLRVDEASKCNKGKRRGELQTDIEALELTFARWLARLDKKANFRS
jgi:hypothetical protein